MQLVTVGTVAFDNIETPFGRADKVVGGAATYISLGGLLLPGASQGIVSVVGDDFPTDMMDLMRAKGIDQAGLEVLKGKESFFWSRPVPLRHEHARHAGDAPERAAGPGPETSERHYKAAPYLMLGNLDPKVQAKVLDQMEATPRMVVMDTMNFWMDSAMDDLKKVIKPGGHPHHQRFGGAPAQRTSIAW
jgi:hypothetical protein